MLRYDVRFWDKINKRMILNAGISPNQLPIVQHGDGRLEELRGEFVPMLCTYQKATNGYIWEGDVIECDVPLSFGDEIPPMLMKARGIMQFNQARGMFTVNIASSPQTQGQEFHVKNSVIIGCAVSNPELLQINQQNYENQNTSESDTDKGAGDSQATS